MHFLKFLGSHEKWLEVCEAATSEGTYNKSALKKATGLSFNGVAGAIEYVQLAQKAGENRGRQPKEGKKPFVVKSSAQSGTKYAFCPKAWFVLLAHVHEAVIGIISMEGDEGKTGEMKIFDGKAGTTTSMTLSPTLHDATGPGQMPKCDQIFFVLENNGFLGSDMATVAYGYPPGFHESELKVATDRLANSVIFPPPFAPRTCRSSK